MSTPRRLLQWVLPILGLLLLGAPTRGWAADIDKNLAATWADFNHYVLIARPDLAAADAQTLLAADNARLLGVVENSDYATEFARTLDRASKTKGLEEAATSLARKIQEARIARSRDPQRITADILKLAGGPRESLNATERLTAAGQFAAPALLGTLLDDSAAPQHPYVIKAMAAIGQPMIAPLSQALPQLGPRSMVQVAQALAQIGYPRALPALKEVLENPKIDPTARKSVQTAYAQLAAASNLPADLSAAELYLRLGQSFYQTQTTGGLLPGYEKGQNQGTLWDYKPDVGLIAIPVPGAVFGDALAMQAAQKSLTLDPKMDAALTLWLTANLRRENKLAGAADPSYPAHLKSAGYYLKLAGPVQQQAILTRGLDDNDVALVFNAIDALAQTAGVASLVQAAPGGRQPLIRALYHDDARVRLRAALVLTRGQNIPAFSDSDQVVKVLGEAIAGDDADSAQAAITAVRDLAARHDPVFHVEAAQTALVNSLTKADKALAAADVLAMFNTAPAQQALAQAGLNSDASAESRVAMLSALARSARAFGNKLDADQVAKITTLASDSSADLAAAAAKVSGALALPASSVVKLITE